jgi:hypothetical protein
VKDAVHTTISLGIALWFGLCIGLTIWLLHPSPDEQDPISVAYALVLFFVGALIAKYTVLAGITIIEKIRSYRRTP